MGKKRYVIGPESLSKLKRRYPDLKNRGADAPDLFVFGWVSKILKDQSRLSLIVSDKKPDVIVDEKISIPRKERAPETDESQRRTRQDSVWGDLKHFSIIGMREVLHRFEHWQKERRISKKAPTNLWLRLVDPTLFEGLISGQGYYFRIAPRKTTFTDLLFGKRGLWEIWSYEFDSDQITKTQSALEDYAGYEEKQTRKEMWVALAAFLFMLSPFIYTSYRNRNYIPVTPQEERYRATMIEKTRETISTIHEKSLESLVEKFKRQIEPRKDIGILMNAANSIGRLSFGENAPNDELPILNVYVQKNWKHVSYESRVSGLEKLCAIWATILKPKTKQDLVVLRLIEDTETRVPATAEYRRHGLRYITNVNSVEVGKCEYGRSSWVQR